MHIIQTFIRGKFFISPLITRHGVSSEPPGFSSGDSGIAREDSLRENRTEKRSGLPVLSG
jgi:hypothetical protein